MRHRATAKFWIAYDSLPNAAQKLADNSFELLKNDARHASLRLKKIGPDAWSARITKDYRALAIQSDDGLVWIWIGAHDEYQRLIKSLS